MIEFFQQHWLPIVIGILMLGFSIYFYAFYWRLSSSLKKELQIAINKTKSIKKHKNESPALDDVKNCFSHSENLKPLWKEYSETVHGQEGNIFRATVPAETFFNTAVIVDVRLNTEFFRHLPGIITGIGIIATFSGLYFSLQGFAADIESMIGLTALIAGVKEALLASGIAIFVAMFITFIEKNQLNNRYKQTEELAQAVDALYNAGAGEEYLRDILDISKQILKSSEQNQSHTAALKDAMVNDLKTMLENMSTTIAAGFSTAIAEQTIKQETTNKQLVSALTEGMQPAIDSMKDAVNKLAGQQGTGVEEFIKSAIGDAKEQFGAQLLAFGQSLQTAGELLDQNIPKMTTAGESMQQAGGDILSASQQFTTSVADMQVAAVSMNGATDGLKTASMQIENTSSNMNTAASSIESYLTQYAKHNDTLNQTIEQINRMVFDLKDRNELGQEQVRQMTQIVEQMRTAQQEAAVFGEQVSTALAKGYGNFATNVETSIKAITNSYFTEMNRSVNAIGGSIEQLDESLDKIVQIARKV